MDFRNRINSFERKEQRSFSNFGGGQYFNAGGAGMLDPNGRTLTISVQNTNTATTKTAYIFGSNYDLTDALQDAAIAITVAEASSYLTLKTDLLSSPIRILGARFNVTTVPQLSQPWNVIRQTPTGEYDSRYIQPISYRSAQNTIQTQVDMMSFALLVTKDVRLSFVLKASEIVTFTFYIKEKLDTSDILKGQNVVKSTDQSVPTGLPQIDMLGQNF
jgi:hypothetical protein